MDRYGITRRRGPIGAGREPFTKARLEELYVQRRLTVAQVGVELGGWSSKTVLKALHNCGIPSRQGGAPRKSERLGTDTLRRRYLDERWSIAEIAKHHGLARSTVSKMIRKAGIPTRPGGVGRRPADRPPRVEELRGLPPVRAALRDHPVRAGLPLAEGFLRRLYGALGLTLLDIELLTGRSQYRVTRDLDSYGIERRPPLTPVGQVELDVDTLRRLYLDEGRSTAEIGEAHGLSASAVRRRLQGAGIPLRCCGGDHHRHSRGSEGTPGSEPACRG